MDKRNILGALTAIGLLLTGCGRDTGVNPTILAAGQTSYANPNGTTSTSYLSPAAQPRTTGTAAATPGGVAVATANGYVYEQNPMANTAGYSFYNAQNPCLFPQAGQTSNCSSSMGTASGYYTGQQPGITGTTGTIYPTAAAAGSPSYASTMGTTGTSTALPPGTVYATPAAGTSSYATPAGTTYATPAGTTSPYGATSPYGTATPAGTTNPYDTTTSAYGATSPYGTATPAANPYGTATAPATTAPATSYASQSVSSSDKARSRIDTSAPSSTKKGPSF